MARLIYTVLAVVSCSVFAMVIEMKIRGNTVGMWCVDIAGFVTGFVVVRAWCEWRDHRELKKKRKTIETHMSGHKVIPNWPNPPRRYGGRRGDGAQL